MGPPPSITFPSRISAGQFNSPGYWNKAPERRPPSAPFLTAPMEKLTCRSPAASAGPHHDDRDSLDEFVSVP